MSKRATEEQAERQLVQRSRQRVAMLQQTISLSQSRQVELIGQIKAMREIVVEQEAALATPHFMSSIDYDIRNSQLVSSVDLERKRWLAHSQQTSFQMAGQAEELKQKEAEIRSELLPARKRQLIKLLKKKAELMQNLSNLRADSPLYVSHQRVLLKQFLEEVREWNKEEVQEGEDMAAVNDRLQQSIASLTAFLKTDQQQPQ